ncbi:indolepyruvate ferredoxin oxidoreductase, beta subunit [Methanocella conradii HZ254]|uniref:Indolepyruvate ferredoxin oxidoreductase subunit beta n=1 Tax=Methanocella conradii (strain DSM 24694 / JCM 17849 / CGMCC 1.5162 / HZ254) TaxID=1041930 RepID=H8I7C7_METCZ|nr:indolepyruvate oxidoreductase subunit beta [Methanocella conradii]AFD00793.1 indolepyruvate ferredoxin oxidoreductase, beta subunit [Methanocella conradii HZ254]
MDRFDLLIVGVGGQGVILASDIIGKAAVLEGRPVRSAETHGMAQRGGAVENHVRIGCKYGSLIPAGGADCLLSMEPLEALRFARYLSPKGIAIINTEKIVPVTVSLGKVQYPEVDIIIDTMKGLCSGVKAENYTALAKKAGAVQALNVAMIGAVSKYLPVRADTLKEAIARSVPPKTVAVNLRAFDLGREA